MGIGDLILFRIVHGGPLGFLSDGAPYTFFATVSLTVNVNALGNVMGGVLCITSSRAVGGYRRLDTFQDCTRRSSWLS